MTDFSADLEAFAKHIDAAVGQVRRKVSLDAFTKITDRTPVDKGRAKSGWEMADARPTDTDTGGGPKNNASFQEDYGVTWIANTVPYIGKLEFEGHSKQAPSGMVRVSLAELETELETLKDVL